MRSTRPGTRDSLGDQCAGCGHSNNWHQPGDLCVVKVEQGSDKRCGCTYVSPNADLDLADNRPKACGTCGNQGFGCPDCVPGPGPEVYCGESTCPDFGSTDMGEGTCAAEHAELRTTTTAPQPSAVDCG